MTFNNSASTQALAPSWTARRNIQHVFQYLTQWLLIGLTFVALAATSLAVFSILPWVELNLPLSSGEIVQAGIWVQVLGSLLLLGLCFFIPSISHMQTLERTHRDFSVSLSDVAQAYHLSHAADRTNAFTLSSEFDSMRERLSHMREHPDLGNLEPEVLELAAQMSFTTRDLAHVYSDEKVSRAKSFLKQRQQELDKFSEKLSLAAALTEDLKRWKSDLEVSEQDASNQLDLLARDLQELMPHLGYSISAVTDLGEDLTSNYTFTHVDQEFGNKVVSLTGNPQSSLHLNTTDRAN